MAYNKHKRKNRQFYPKTNRATSYAVVGETVKNQPKPGTEKQFVCNYVTLANKTLSGSQTVDSHSPTNGDKILVANQSDKMKNGIYTYSDSDDWKRDLTISPGAIITITGGTKQGTVWVVETDEFVIGTDNIVIVESALNRKGSDYDSFSALAAADEDLLLAEDYSDSYNKKRVSLSALKTFFNFLSKAANTFTTFTSVTPDEDDVLLVEDDSDSFNKKKITIGDILGMVPEAVVAAQYTLYVSPTFPNENRMYSTFAAAIAYANTAPNDAHVWTIRTYSGLYEGNYDVNKNIVETIGNVEFKPSSNSSPLMSFEGGRLTGNALLTNGAETMTVPLVTVKTGAKIQAKRIVSNIRAIEVQSNAGNPTVDLEIDVHDLGDVKDANTGGAVLMKLNANSCSGVELVGNTNSKYHCEIKSHTGKVKLSTGTLYMDTQRYTKLTDTIVEITGGAARISGTVDSYSDTTGLVTQSGGTLKLHQFFAKNGGGSVIDGTAGTLIIGNSVLQAGDPGGGLSPTISGTPSYTVTYNNATSLNSDPIPSPGMTQNVEDNRLVDSAVTI